MDDLIQSSERLLDEYRERGLTTPMGLHRAIDSARDATGEHYLDALINLTDEFLTAWDNLRFRGAQ